MSTDSQAPSIERTAAHRSPTVWAVCGMVAAFITQALPMVPERYKPVIAALGALLGGLAVLYGRKGAADAADQALKMAASAPPPPPASPPRGTRHVSDATPDLAGGGHPSSPQGDAP